MVKTNFKSLMLALSDQQETIDFALTLSSGWLFADPQKLGMDQRTMWIIDISNFFGDTFGICK